MRSPIDALREARTALGDAPTRRRKARDAARTLRSFGDRAEVEWRIGEAGFTLETLPYSLNGGLAFGDPTPLLDVAVTAPAPAPAGLAWAFDGAASALMERVGAASASPSPCDCACARGERACGL